MLRELIAWIVSFVISAVVSRFTRMDQGMVFFYIYVGSEVFLVLAGLILLVFCNAVDLFPVGEILEYLIELAIIVVFTWELSRVFGIDFYVAYQLVSFGQILCPGFIEANREINDDDLFQ